MEKMIKSHVTWEDQREEMIKKIIQKISQI